MATRARKHLGRYKIRGEIGRGAMGIVYLARDTQIARLVAIKTISLLGQDSDEEREYRERFLLEAQAAGRLSHPGIVSIFDVGEETRTRSPYIVMEYVDGRSLKKLLKETPEKLPLGVALRLVQRVAEALDYAHSQGVVHRDIKPANILVAAAGNPKVTDFGIAKLNQAHLTLPGQVLGSPAYMAPEQLGGEGVDARSDLFSLGVILYTMLTGHRPFQGNSATTVCFKLVNHDPLPVTVFDPKLPPELGRLVMHAMAKNPSERYQTGMEMALAIGQFMESNNVEEPASHSWISKPPVLGQQSQGGAVASKIAHVPETSASALGQSVQRASHLAGWKPNSRKILLLACVFAVGTTGIFYRHFRFQREEAPSTPVAMQLPPISNPPLQEPLATPVAKVRMQIEIEHQFANAEASVWLDNRLVYSRSLYGSKKSRMLVFRKSYGHTSEAVQLPKGKHRVKVRVQSESDKYDQSKTVPAYLRVNGKNKLWISCDRKNKEMKVELQ
jgi:serine/threonine protein kinase